MILLVRRHPRAILDRNRHVHLTRHVPIVVHICEPFTAHLQPEPAVARRLAPQYSHDLRLAMATVLEHIQLDYANATHPGDGAWWMPAQFGGAAPPPTAAREIDLHRMRAERTSRHWPGRRRSAGRAHNNG